MIFPKPTAYPKKNTDFKRCRFRLYIFGSACHYPFGRRGTAGEVGDRAFQKDTGQTFYILDEPTTGLHFQDIQHLLDVLNRLVDKGNTVLIIEHNMDVIKVADHIIDIGPEGGDKGGKLVAFGTPEEVTTCAESYTAEFLKAELGVVSPK